MTNEKLTQKENIELLTSLAKGFEDNAKMLKILSVVPLIMMFALMVLDLLKIGKPVEMWIFASLIALSAMTLAVGNGSKIKANELNLLALIQVSRKMIKMNEEKPRYSKRQRKRLGKGWRDLINEGKENTKE